MKGDHMKRISLAFILGLLVLGSSTSSFAIFGPPPLGGGGVVALILSGVLGSGSNAAAPSDKQSAVPSDEFSALNNNPEYADLLKQSAGGAFNTLDILN
jgi:hypothetical protein